MHIHIRPFLIGCTNLPRCVHFNEHRGCSLYPRMTSLFYVDLYSFNVALRYKIKTVSRLEYEPDLQHYPRNVRFPSSGVVPIPAWRSDTILLESSNVFYFSIMHHEHHYPSKIITFQDSQWWRHFFEAKLPLANIFGSKTCLKIDVGKQL